MRTLGWLLVVLAAVGCRKSPETVVDAGTAAAPVTPPQPKRELVLPKGPATLSVFSPTDAGCAWSAVDVTADAGVELASFPVSCVGARVAWSPDAKKAVVWFDPRHVQQARYSSSTSSPPGYADEKVDEAAAARAFTVDLATGAHAALPIPTTPNGQSMDELALGPDGAPLAFFLEPLSDDAQKAGHVTRDGQTFDLGAITEGLPALATAQRFAGGKWTHAERKLTTTGWDYGLGVRELDAFRTLGPRSVDLSEAHAQGDVAEGAESKALKKLSPKKAGPDDGEWIFIGAGGARLYAWEVTAEFAYTTGLLAAGTPPKPLEGLGFTDGDLVAIRSSADYVLVTAADVGTHPRLYAMPGATLVFASDTARAVTFWPTTAKPESHEAGR